MLDTKIIYVASKEQLEEILEEDNVSTDLRLPVNIKKVLNNVVISGQPWGRRGNNKLVSIILNDHRFITDSNIRTYKEVLTTTEPNCSILHTIENGSLTLNVSSNNLATVVKAVNILITEMFNTGINKELISINLSTDLPSWTGVNYYTSDIMSLFSIIQLTSPIQQVGKVYFDVENTTELHTLILVQIALVSKGKIRIILNTDEIGRKIWIQSVKNLIAETITPLNTGELDKLTEIRQKRGNEHVSGI